MSRLISNCVGRTCHFVDFVMRRLIILSQQAHDVNITSPQRRCNVIQRAHDVNITSPQRRCNVIQRAHDVNITSLQRRCNVIQRAHDVNITSLQRRCNVIQRAHDVASTLKRRYIYVMCPLGLFLYKNTGCGYSLKASILAPCSCKRV